MTIFQEGVEANRMGKPLSANPYVKSLPDYFEWLAGWKAEQAEFEKANRCRPPGTADIKEL